MFKLAWKLSWKPWVLLVWADYKGWQIHGRYWRRRRAHLAANNYYDDQGWNCWVVHKRVTRGIVNE